jgi:hypothetical protein
MRSNDDMGQSQAIGLTVVGVTISLVLWAGLARVAASNERLAASKIRLAQSNERLAAAMNAQRAYAPTPDLNQKGARKVSVWGDHVVTIHRPPRNPFRNPFVGRARSGAHPKYPPVSVVTYSPYPRPPAHNPRATAPPRVRTSASVTITEAETGPKRSRVRVEVR